VSPEIAIVELPRPSGGRDVKATARTPGCASSGAPLVEQVPPGIR
jgi:hypothetical protein